MIDQKTFYDIPRNPIKQGENTMAEIDTVQLSSEHAALGRQIGAEACAINKHIGDARYEGARENGDIRRETQAGFADTRFNIAERSGDIRRELANETCHVVGTVKDARHDTITKVDQTGDRLSDKVGATTDMIKDRLFAVGRDTMDLRAQVTGLGIQVRDNAQLSALQTEKAVLQNTIEGQKNTQYLNDRITTDGEKTRALINDLKYHDLSRGLVERNTELVNCEQDRRYYRDRWHDGRWDQVQTQFAGQWAQLQSQIQAFQSQLQETRQGMVNFGTMAGVGQSSTSNNVR